MLRDWLPDGGSPVGSALVAREITIFLSDMHRGSAIPSYYSDLNGRSLLVATRDQLTTAMALIELDGLVRRLVLMPPDVQLDHLPTIIAAADVEAVVTSVNDHRDFGVRLQLAYDPAIVSTAPRTRQTYPHRTEWVLFTSGTTGVPKMVTHSLAGLSAAINPGRSGNGQVVWATFYDIRRFGGLQIFLRSIIDGGSLILSDAEEPIADHLKRLGRHGVTHISGTPSHWRRVLMSPAAAAIAPQYIRLSGEIADQTILDNLRETYPRARIAHAYASTEAGVGFEVNDGLEGFPSSVIGQAGDVQMKISDGSLRIRSNRNAVQYISGKKTAVAENDGFVDTGDILEKRGERYYFVGRKNGIINVGGLKVHPEEVEAVINRHPKVRMSLVRARKNPITGSIVVAEIVLKRTRIDSGTDDWIDALKRDILERCRSTLAQHKVPVVISFVSALPVGEAGKLVRPYA